MFFFLSFLLLLQSSLHRMDFFWSFFLLQSKKSHTPGGGLKVSNMTRESAFQCVCEWERETASVIKRSREGLGFTVLIFPLHRIFHLTWKSAWILHASDEDKSWSLGFPPSMCYTFPSISTTSPVDSGRWRERYLALGGWGAINLQILSAQNFPRRGF